LNKPVQSFDERIKAKFAHVEREREDMHGYQVEDVQFFKDNPFTFGLIDLGLGKTVTAGTLLADLLADFIPGKVLVIGPIPVIATSWPDEFRTWRHLAHLNFTVLREDDNDPRLKAARKVARLAGENQSAAETAERRKIREELASSRPMIHLINFEGIEWLAEFHGRKWPYRTVIIDESSMLKSHQGNRWNVLKRIVLGEGFITRMHLLTATPASESYEAFFSQTFLLDGGKRFGKFITHFRNEYFNFNKYSMKYVLRPSGEEAILSKIADISTVRKRKDYYKVEDPQIIQRRVTLNADQFELYTSMQDEYVLTLPNGIEVEAETAAALSQKLSQMASGVLYENKLGFPEDYDQYFARHEVGKQIGQQGAGCDSLAKP